jgi:hypothetical protein
MDEAVNVLKEYGEWCSDISFNVADVDGIIEKRALQPASKISAKKEFHPWKN